DGLDPEIGDRSTSFILKVKYADSDDDAPANGYPKVHIKKGGAEISGSPFAMTETNAGDTTYTDGKLYSYSKVLTSTGTDYTYYFEAQDALFATAVGTPTSEIDNPDVTNITPTLSWTGESNYITDGIEPGVAHTGSTFIFRIKYTDSDNDAPASLYPKVHIKKGGAEISGSPFAMTETDAGDTTYTDGKLYTYSKILTSIGTDYTYYFEAQDIYSGIATGTPTNEVDAPDVTNNVPTLDWTGEANYASDGLNLETGLHTESFVFRVKYTDSDNDAPAPGYPKIHIKKGGAEISGSPFAMTETDAGDTTYTDGKLYSLTKTLVPGADYTYYFEAQDIYNGVATGTPLTPIDAPDVSNNSPTLTWTEEANYTTDGLDPEVSGRSTNYVFRVKYTDSDNDAPATGQPKLYILKGGTTVQMLEMNYISGASSTGAIYSTSTVLATLGTDYSYHFTAYDVWGDTATGISTATIDAPDVGLFDLETIDGDGIIAGDFNSLAVDSQGNIHIAYSAIDTAIFRYVKWSSPSGPWSDPVTVGAGMGNGSQMSIALDANELPNISLLYNSSLYYAKCTAQPCDSDKWTIKLVDAGSATTGERSSIAIDGGNNIHISHFASAGIGLKYAKSIDGGISWSTKTLVDGDGDQGQYSSLALDGAGNPKISYTGIAATNLSYIESDDGGDSWMAPIIVDADYPIGTWTSLALDGSGHPRISYYDQDNKNLKYAEYNGSSWSKTTVAYGGAGSTEFYTSIVLDGEGNPHIAYRYNYDSNIETKLHYAGFDGVFWSTYTLDSNGDTGRCESIAMAPDGGLHISYFDSTNTDLKAAHWDSAGFSSPMGGNSRSKSQAPSGFVASGSDHYEITWSWQDNSSNEYGFAIYGATSSAGPFALVAGTTTIVANQTTYTETGLSMGTTYFRYVSAVNAGGIVTSSGALMMTPIVNSAPALIWTGETNYTTDGINPVVAHAGSTFVYRVKYTDLNNDAPASGYPKVHIKKSGAEISGSPFAMTFVSSTTYVAGAIYTYSKVLNSDGTDYTYYFEAQDALLATAVGTPTSEINNPDVTNVTPTLSWTGESNYIADGIEPGVAHTGSTFIFRIKYTDSDNDAPAPGYPNIHIKKGGS
ncbi:MAG: hypothetical protein L6420_07365, partial [Elusimicrobia bacterium]|nr:hypothetical protein [Elusimicrobiota bacterium]